MFCGVWKTRPRCPTCDLKYERESGFFVGSMYFAYFLGVIALLPLAIVLFSWGWNAWVVGLCAEVQLLILSPLLFRYSRVLWLHLDQCLDPR